MLTKGYNMTTIQKVGYSNTELVKPITVDSECKKFLQYNVKPEQVSHITETCMRLFGAAMENPSLLMGGRGTSKIILFEANNSPYICRVTDATRPAFFIDPASEIHNMWAVNDLHVAPKLHHADLQSGVIIMDYIQPSRLTPELFEDEQQSANLYRELGNKTRQLHQGPHFTNVPTNIFTDLESTIKVANIGRAPSLALEVLENIRKLEPVLNRHQVCVPSHKDLHSNNVLYDGISIYFIDWELGANADRFIDLACLSIFYAFDEHQDEELLKNYFQETPTPKQKAQAYLMKQVCLGFYGFRLLRRVTGIGEMDLSNVQMPAASLPKFKDFILQKYNCCSDSFTTEELKIFPFMFLNEAMKNMQSEKYQKAITILTQIDGTIDELSESPELKKH
jgi:thiamine kinase-like enzyme